MRRADWIAAAFSIVAMAWMITQGTWEFFGTTGHLESFFDAQAESLLHGRIDVPREAISYEAWVRDGKSYGYFGPTPALFRIPLVLLFPEMKGHWSRLSMFAACLTMLLALWLLQRWIERILPELREDRWWHVLRPVFVLATCIGSTQYFILAESKVYQEASAWSSSLAFLSLVCAGRYLESPRRRWLAISCLTAFLAFQARVSTGAGPLFALLLVAAALLFPKLRGYFGAPEVPSQRTAVAMLAMTLAISSFAWAGLNKWKFGRWLTSQPIELNLEFNAERIAKLKGDIVSLANLPVTAYVYLNPAHIGFSHIFPWVSAIAVNREKLTHMFPAAHIDLATDVVAVPTGVPELFFGALAGTVLLLGRWGKRLRTLRIPLCGAAAGCGIIFLFGFMTTRYLHDMFPWLVIGTAGAFGWVFTDGRANWRKPAMAGFAALTIWAMWMMFGLAFVEQRWLAPGITTEQHMAALDLFAANQDGGIGGLFKYWGQWREYKAATSFESGTLALDSTFVPYRGNQPVARSAGSPPYSARYVMNVPADGQYELSIREASSAPRPLVLSINGQPVGYVCTVATGGDNAASLKWTAGGRHALRKGPVSIGLSSNNEFPILQALRLARVD